ncbi:MAG: MBOAT family protein [Bacteroidia bacterium]|nr:MBOAT family protein [Bacteroidia bacterium]MBP9688465.1 MBOAT family protein [Bacteroidia bacterium]
MSEFVDKIIAQLLYNPDEPILFNTGFFLYFLLAFMGAYLLLHKRVRIRTIVFTLFSLYFFYKACGYYVGLVIIAAIVDFGLSNLIYKTAQQTQKKLLLTFSIVINLGLLFYFKYTDFFIGITNDLGFTSITPLSLLLPIGISFYTFENISYTVDVYRGEFKPVRSFWNYLFFLSFFPKLVMGPIVRAADFIPQINKPYLLTNTQLAKGAYLIAAGLIKKVVISDFIYTNMVQYVFDAPMRYTGLECLLAVYGYALVIYCDFSGYSDMAIGLGKWLGFDININFLSPYQSKSITEFWRRWHISLSSWLRDYLYIPLGGNKLGKLRQYINLFITMLIGGLWHGANFTFVIWGALHGLALAIDKLRITYFKNTFQIIPAKIRKYLGVIITFNFVCFAWIFFKASSIDIAFEMIHQIINNFNLNLVPKVYITYAAVIGMMVFGFILHSLEDNLADKLIAKFGNIPLWVYIVGFTGLIVLLVQFKTATPVLPIYLQF